MTPLQQADDIREYALRAWQERHAATAMILNDAADTIERLAKRIAELEKRVALDALEKEERHDALCLR